MKVLLLPLLQLLFHVLVPVLMLTRKEMDGVMMRITIVDVNGMVETAVEIM